MTQAAPVTHPQIPIETLSVGATVDSVYVVASLDRKVQKNGKPFFLLTLTDATGSLPAVMWDNHDVFNEGLVGREDFVRVQGDVGEFRNANQLVIRKARLVPETEVSLGDFLPVSPRDRAEMEAEMDAHIASVQDPDCARLLRHMLGNARMRDAYCTCPAAVKMHQAYIHGLLDHTLCVIHHALSCSSLYGPINRDLLLTGAILHDIGKTRELSWRRSFSYTEEGRLIGHVVLGTMMVDNAIRELAKDAPFDETIRRHLLHLILSHHGKLEWGAAATPKTREAMLLHHADYIDAFMFMASDEMEKASKRGDQWTTYSKIFEGYLYAGMPSPKAAAANGIAIPGELDPRMEKSRERSAMEDLNPQTAAESTL